MDQEPRRPDDEPTPNSRSGTGPEGLPDYDSLIRRYGEAMHRIGQLEAQVDRLIMQLGTGDGRGRHAESPDSGRLARAVEAPTEVVDTREELPTRAGEEFTPGTPPDTSPRGPQSAQPAQSGRDDLRQMRIQITSLTGELSQAKEELLDARGHQSRHRRRPRSKPWWKSLGRRLGLVKRRE